MKEYTLINANLLDDQSKLDNIKLFNKYLNEWKYGVLINNRIETDSDKIDWGRYKTIPIKKIEKYHVGICWDFVNYQHNIFKKNKYSDTSYFFVMERNNNPNDIVTHTFSIINIKNKQYWFESSWMKYQGVHNINSYRDVINKLIKEYGLKNKYLYDVYEYNPEGLDNNLTNKKFFSKASKKLIYSNTINKIVR